MELTELGWDSGFDGDFAPFREAGYAVGRIVSEQKNIYTIFTERGDMPAVLTGKLYYESLEREDLPVIGDWAVITILDDPKAVIHGVLPRRSKFSRRAAGTRACEQPVAANIDTVFITVGLDGDYNIRRIERYLTLAWESGAEPVVLLTKADLCPDGDTRLQDVQKIALGVPIHQISVRQRQGLEALDPYLRPGRTVALLGSSGVGKSTLLNYWLGKAVQRVQTVREDDSHGRHTTTHRQIFRLPSGALVLDTPGMRELQLWDAGDGLHETFADIAEIAAQCRYSDCRHENEPGCAVRAARQAGTLDDDRYDSYRKLQRELAYLEAKRDPNAERARNQRWKQIAKQVREITKHRK